jgi:hypothetical protein
LAERPCRIPRLLHVAQRHRTDVPQCRAYASVGGRRDTLLDLRPDHIGIDAHCSKDLTRAVAQLHNSGQDVLAADLIMPTQRVRPPRRPPKNVLSARRERNLSVESLSRARAQPPLNQVPRWLERDAQVREQTTGDPILTGQQPE